MSLTTRNWLIAGGALVVAFLAAFAIGSATKSDAGGTSDDPVKPLSTSSYAKPSVAAVAAPAALPAAASAPKPKRSTPSNPTPSPSPSPTPSPSPSPSPTPPSGGGGGGGGSSGGPVIEG